VTRVLIICPDKTGPLMAGTAIRSVEIARALAASPSMLLLDEPAAGLTHGEHPSVLAARDLRLRCWSRLAPRPPLRWH
jgi:ABC-type branched-subunit amino acid transport system ATPase component